MTNDLLLNLLTTTTAAIDTILADSGRTWADVSGVELEAGDPLVIRLLTTRGTFVGTPYGELGTGLAHAFGEFLAAAVNRAEEAIRVKVAAVMAAGGMLVAKVDMAFGSITATVVSADGRTVDLITLQAGDVH